MKYHLLFFYAELKRSLIRMKRYPLQTLANLVATYAMFVVMAFGLKAIGNITPDELGRTLVGYVMWSFASLVILGAVGPIMHEMSIGVLEQVYLSALRPFTILTYRTIVGIILELVQATVLFLLICVTFDIRVDLPLLPLLIVLFLTGIGLYGFGLVLAGIAVIYKQIGRVVQLLQLALLFLTGALIPLESLPRPIQILGEFLPLSLSIKITRHLTDWGWNLRQVLESRELLYLILNSGVYLVLGIGVFMWTDRVARRQGLLGQY
jgi:ABC-2 type transport system permease protein